MDIFTDNGYLSAISTIRAGAIRNRPCAYATNHAFATIFAECAITRFVSYAGFTAYAFFAVNFVAFATEFVTAVVAFVVASVAL